MEITKWISTKKRYCYLDIVRAGPMSSHLHSTGGMKASQLLERGSERRGSTKYPSLAQDVAAQSSAATVKQLGM